MTAQVALDPTADHPHPAHTGWAPPGPRAVAVPTHAEGVRERAERQVPYVQDPLAVDFAAASDEQLFGPQPTPVRDLPDPREWAAHLAQGIVEVMHGARPAAQVIRWTSPEVYAVVARRGALAARREAALRGAERRVPPTGPRHGPGRTRVTRVLVCEPCHDVAEAAVVLLDGRRVRAMAMRLVGRDGRWVVDALQIG